MEEHATHCTHQRVEEAGETDHRRETGEPAGAGGEGAGGAVIGVRG